ncbi:MAG: hypothetical protein LKI98_04600 [Bifidobacterium crudilactis]|jgi:hypothetical protein|nr:hypothetical protein [Bifidobacterium crudilactis]
MFDFSSLPPQAIAAIILMAIIIALIVLAGLIASATREVRQTVDAILGISEDHSKTPSASVRYGFLHLPLTLGHPKRMCITVPVRSIPHVRTEAQANKLGAQIRDTYGMDSCETSLRRAVRRWDLKR